MKISIKLGCLLFILGLASSCLGPTPKVPGQELEEADKQASLILRKAHFENKNGRYFHARELVRPLLKHETAGREAKLLMKEIGFNIQFRNIRREQDLSGKVALNEVEKRLLLPESMNKTRKYVPQVGPFNVEKGPAEELLTKPINVDLENADIAGVLEALRQVEGLSFIADEGIETTNTLTIKITNVPLRDVLGYIERNMGLMFHVTKDVVWVMQGPEDEDEGPKGPNLETKIIHLKKGYLPEGGGSGGNSSGSQNNRSGGGNSSGALGNAGGNAKGGAASSAGNDDLLDALEAFFADDGTDKAEGAKFQIFRNRNILVVRDTRENIRMVQELIDAFDRDPMQVIIETRFVTVGKGDLFKLGAQINRLSKADKPIPQPDENGNYDPADLAAFYAGESDGITATAGNTIMGLQEATGSLQLAGLLDNFMYDVTISMLSQLDSSKTVEAPRITVVNNKSARIRRGKTISYFEEFDVQTGSGTIDPGTGAVVNDSILAPQGSPQEIDEGLTLEVTPSVGNDGKSIAMQLNLNSTNIENFNTTVSANASYTLPQPSETEIETTVVVGNGQTVVLGGTISHNVFYNVKKIPLLGDIPLIGFLFRYEQKTREPEHLLVFVTASVLDIDGRHKLAVEKEDAAREAAKVLATTSLNPEDLLKDDPNPTDFNKAAEALREAGIDPVNVLKIPLEDDGNEPQPDASAMPKPAPQVPNGRETTPTIDLPKAE